MPSLLLLHARAECLSGARAEKIIMRPQETWRLAFSFWEAAEFFFLDGRGLKKASKQLHVEGDMI